MDPDKWEAGVDGPVAGGSPVNGDFMAELAPLLGLDLGERAPVGASPPVPPPVRSPERAAATEVTDATDHLARALDRIARSEPDVRAWVLVDEAGARTQAAEADRRVAEGGSPGLLHGVPLAVKDLVDVAGLPTRSGSRHHAAADLQPAARDAPSVRALRDAGAVVLGKTATHEFALGGTTPPTRNPHDLDRIPGGSSGGSAAAVAAGHVPLALGTDTGGSVRIPASYCGTAGFVPTRGRVPLEGVVPLAWSLDRVGLLAPTVSQLVPAWCALGGDDVPRDRVAFQGLRVGVPSFGFAEPLDPQVRAVVERALDAVRQAGAEFVPIEVPSAALAVATGMTIILAESADYHRQRSSEATRHLFGPDVAAALALADTVPAAAYVRAQRVRGLLTDELLAALARVDVLALPTMPCTAPTWAEASTGRITVAGRTVPVATAHLRNTVPFNLSGMPCGTAPCGEDARGLPVGLQWAAAPGRDDLVLGAMAAFEALGGG